MDWTALASDEMRDEAAATDMVIAPPAAVEDGQGARLDNDSVPLVQFAPNSTVLVCYVPIPPADGKPGSGGAGGASGAGGADGGADDDDGQQPEEDGGSDDDDAASGPPRARLLFYCLRSRRLLRVVNLHETVHCLAVTHVLSPAIPDRDHGSMDSGSDGGDGTSGDGPASASSGSVASSADTGAGGDGGDALVPHLVVALGTSYNRVVVVDERGDVVGVSRAQANPITSLTFFDQPLGHSAPPTGAMEASPPTTVLGLAGASGGAVHVWDDVLALGYEG